MIIDNLKNWNKYTSSPAWKKAFDFLSELPPDADEQRYDILGDDIFALVMSYETKNPADAVLEAHQKYVDIQSVLIGSEGIEWFNREGLLINTPYDEVDDYELFNRECPGPARVDVYPGMFVTLFPEDAHMPGLIVGKHPSIVKKVVVKVKTKLFNIY
jgi:biofilm protein TabA